MSSSSTAPQQQSDPTLPPSGSSSASNASGDYKLTIEKIRWMECDGRWITISEQLVQSLDEMIKKWKEKSGTVTSAASQALEERIRGHRKHPFVKIINEQNPKAEAPTKVDKNTIIKSIFHVKKTDYDKNIMKTKLQGMRIPDYAFTTGGSGNSSKAKGCYIAVYFLTEYLARCFKLRVSKKKRQRKKKNAEIQTNNNNNNMNMDMIQHDDDGKDEHFDAENASGNNGELWDRNLSQLLGVKNRCLLSEKNDIFKYRDMEREQTHPVFDVPFGISTWSLDENRGAIVLAPYHDIMEISVEGRENQEHDVDVPDEQIVNDLSSSPDDDGILQELEAPLSQVDSISDYEDISDNEFKVPDRWYSFDATFPITISSIMYQKTQWTTWPANHILKRLAEKPIEEIEESKASLKNSIMKYQIRNGGPSGLRNNDITMEIVQHYDSEGKLNKLNEILEKLIVFHRKFKHFHSLVKNCLQYWLIQEKENKEKVVKRNEQGETGGNEDEMDDCIAGSSNSNNKSNISDNTILSNITNRENDIEMIDLTGNTSSTNFFSVHEISDKSTNGVLDEYLELDLVSASLKSSNASGKVSKQSSGQQSTPKAFMVNGKNRQIFTGLNESIPHKVIISTLSQVLHLSGADKLLGSKTNTKGLLSFITKAIFLGGMKCSFRMSQFMSFLSSDSRDCEWLKGINDSRIRSHLLAKVALWLFNEYILIILKTGFYVTEMCKSRNLLYFYLREKWISFTQKFYHESLKGGKLLLRGENNQGEVNGKLRLMPKKDNTVRPILSLVKNPSFQLKYPEELYKNLRPQLRHLLVYLNSKIAPHGLLGDIVILHSQWRNFLSKWKSKGCPTLYYAKIDIENAYPSVCMEQLKRILQRWEGEKLDNMYLRRYSCTKQRKTKYCTFLQKKTDEAPLFIQCRSWANYKLVEEVKFEGINRLMTLLKEILQYSVIKVGKKIYELKYGLPQGWPFSQFLCNIYYGVVDREYFPDYLQEDPLDNHVEIFCKNVDDYLFVSTSPDRVMGLLDRMKSTNDDKLKRYNFKINTEKTKHNIPKLKKKNADDASSSLNQPPPTENTVTFCGWKFCLKTGHVMRDLSSYEGFDIVSTLTFDMKNITTNEEFIQKRLQNLSPLRLYAIIFDTKLNCRHRIIRTTLEASLMMAFRFYGMCRVLYPNISKVLEEDSEVGGSRKKRELFIAICKCAKKMARHILALHSHYGAPTGTPDSVLHNCGWSCLGPCTTPVVPTAQDNDKISQMTRQSQELYKNVELTENELLYVIYHGFTLKLKKHPPLGKFFLRMINGCKEGLVDKMSDKARFHDLKKVARQSLPPSFALMKK